MDAFVLALLTATLLCSLITGFLIAFAIVVMPGIGRLKDAEFIRAFQGIDGVIQDGHPVFGFIWLGSILAVTATMAMGLGIPDEQTRLVTVVAAGIYLAGVLLPTFRVNVPLNNWFQSLDTEEMDPDALAAARNRFEAKWNRWNVVRTVASGVASGQLLWVLRIV